jgi:hypothetical protein
MKPQKTQAQRDQCAKESNSAWQETTTEIPIYYLGLFKVHFLIF